MMIVNLEKIYDKNIWIVEDHNEVLLSWSKYRRAVDSSPILLTLDHHTDTHAPFARKIIMPNTKFDLDLQKNS